MRHILNDAWVSVCHYRKISFKKLSFTMIRLFFVLFFCTHCKKGASFQRGPSSVGGEFERHSLVSLLINNGDEYTKEKNVTLTFTPSADADEMFISFDSNCSQGEWEVLPESKSKNIELNQLNQENTVYVKYRYLGREETQCVSDSIIHDDIPPTVGFINPPGPWTTGNLTINLNASDSGSGIKRFSVIKRGVVILNPVV